MSFTDKVVVPSPIVKETEIPNFEAIPRIDYPSIGNVKVDESGNLLIHTLRYRGLTKTLIEVYDNWVTHTLPAQIASRDVKVGYNTVTFKFSRLSKPSIDDGKTEIPMTPHMALERDLNYTSNLTCTVVVTRDDGTDSTLQHVPIAKIPVMIGSVLCNTRGKSEKELIDMNFAPEDPCGYFIIKGQEKNVLIQENQRANKPFVFSNNKGRVYCTLTSVTITESIVMSIEMDSFNMMSINLTAHEYELVGDKKKPQSIPVLSLFDIYSEFEFTKEELIKYLLSFCHKPEWRNKVYRILYINMLYAMDHIDQVQEIFTNEVIGKEEGGFDTLEEILNAMMPHMESDPTSKKMDLLALMIVRLAEYAAGCRSLDNRDDWSNKKLESGGRLLEQLFSSLWRKFLSDLDASLQSSITTTLTADMVVAKMIRSTMNDEFIDSFTPNAWGVKASRITDYKGYMKANVTDFLKRDSLIYTYSHLMRINTPVSKEGKLTHIRVIQGSQLGYVCPIETPEGETCGIVKSMSVTCRLSTENRNKTSIVYSAIEKYITVADYMDDDNNSKLLFNGRFIGWVNGEQSKAVLIRLRRSGILPYDCSIVLDTDNILYVYVDSSRVTRPLLVVENNIPVIDSKTVQIKGSQVSLRKALQLDPENYNFDTLISEGAVEYIDAFEQSSCLLAQSVESLRLHRDEIIRANAHLEKVKLSGDIVEENRSQAILDKLLLKSYDFCEIDPNAMFGVSASLMPLPDHNQAPRNTYQAQMGKQAVGIYNSNYMNRMDPSLKVLAFPQRPMFETQMNEVIGLTGLPNGQMVNVAFMTYTGYNQEDAIIFNQASIDRGLFWYEKLYRFTSTQKTTTGKTYEEFRIPPSMMGDMKKNQFKKINPETHLPDVGTYIDEGEVVIPKVKVTINPDGTRTYTDISIRADEGESGYVRRVIRTYNYKDHLVVKVRIGQLRQPTIGDKFASRYAQKGTIGLILPEEDMPFVESGPNAGMKPDLIINPHSIPSRMTVGKLIEIVASKFSALKGERVNATAYKSVDIDRIKDTLAHYGFNRNGYETMVSGFSGHVLGDDEDDMYQNRSTAQMFMGPCFYQMLPHHVIDKITVRGSQGSIDPITHQPVGGRGHGGGRHGEMEKDAMLSHGASSVLIDRFCVSSDGFYTVQCLNCSTIASVMIETKNYKCKNCGETGKFAKVRFPYSTKYLQHMLAALGIDTRFKIRLEDRSRFGRTSTRNIKFEDEDKQQKIEEEEEEEILLKEKEYDEDQDIDLDF